MSTVAEARRTLANRSLAIGRLGRRTVRAGGWRNVLIVALIAVGIAVATTVAIAARSTDIAPAVYELERFGAVADARIEELWDDGTRFDDLPAELQESFLEVRGTPPAPRPDLPPVPEVVQEVLGDVPLLGLTERHDLPTPGLRMVAVDLGDPMAEGLLRTEAPAPVADEVLLSPAAMRALDVSVGEQVDLDGVGSLTVTGEVRGSTWVEDRLAVVGATRLGAPNAWLVQAGGDAAVQRLAEVINPPVSGDARQHRSFEPRVGHVGFIDPGGLQRVVTEPSFIGSMVGALILLQVGLIAAAAFATGTRRRIREFGLLGSTGAAPDQIRQVVLVEALVLGVAAAVAGTALGVAASVLGRPLIERISGTYMQGIQVHVLDLLGPAAVGLLAAVLAALWPAVTVSRTSVATALAGRVPLRRVPGWLPVASILATGTGLLVLALAIRSEQYGVGKDITTALAVVLTALGAASLGVPLLGGLGRLADRLPVRMRLALRDTVRQRTRSGATVAALVVVLMIPTVVMTSMATDEARFGQPQAMAPAVEVTGPTVDGLRLPVTDSLVTQTLEELPVTPTRVVDLFQLSAWDPSRPGYDAAGITVIDQVPGGSRYAPASADLLLATAELVDALGLDRSARRFLADGGAVDLAPPGTMTDAQREMRVRQARMITGGESQHETPIDLLSVEPAVPLVAGTLVSEETARSLDLPAPRRSVIATLPRALTWPEAAALHAGQTEGVVQLEVHGQVPYSEAPGQLIVPGLALLVALIIIATATALAATESDRDLSVMTAVGADPDVRPIVHSMQATYHTALAAVIAVPTGLVLYRVALREPHGDGVGLALPWLGLAGLAIGIPIVVGVLMRLAMRPARPTAQRRIA